MAGRMDICECGGLKRAVAALCLACRKAKTAADKKPRNKKGRKHPHDSCTCGRQKVVGASQCLTCYRSNLKEKPFPGLRCACGKPKGYRASLCKTCRLELRSRSPVDGKLFCGGCRSDLPISEFYVNGAGPYRSRCKSCCSSEGRRRHLLNRCLRYGMPREEAVKIAELECAACQICGKTVEKFHIDHCHETGRFRGVLCSNCNSGIGLLDDDPELCERAAHYLRDNRPTGDPVVGKKFAKTGPIERQSNLLITRDGVTLSVREWAQKLGVRPGTLYGRLHRGWSQEEVLSIPVGS